MMPDMDGFEVCRRPVEPGHALHSGGDHHLRWTAPWTSAGFAVADDFLTKPSGRQPDRASAQLTRLKILHRRAGACAPSPRWKSVMAPERSARSPTYVTADRILLVGAHRPSAALRKAGADPAFTEHTGRCSMTNPAEALFHAADGNYDLLIVLLSLERTMTAQEP
jgi:two-component system cell cycle response regulator